MQAGSLIISVFGDALFPRGGGIWVGSLAKLLEPLALNERLVRTALFRLVKEDWLQPQVRGRRSDYFLSPTGQHRIAEASRHIYANTDPVWDQRWRLILIAGELQPKEREALRSALFWHGFGSLSPAVFIHPSAELGTAFDALLDEGLGSLRKLLAQPAAPMSSSAPGIWISSAYATPALCKPTSLCWRWRACTAPKPLRTQTRMGSTTRAHSCCASC